MRRRKLLRQLGVGSATGIATIAGCSSSESGGSTTGSGGTAGDTPAGGGGDSSDGGNDGASSGGSDLSFRFGSAHLPERQCWDCVGGASFDEVKRRLAENSNGEVTMQLVIDAQLCLEAGCVSKLNSGVIPTGGSSVSNSTKLMPGNAIWTIPYTFPDDLSFVHTLFAEETWNRFWVPLARKYNVVPFFTDMPDSRSLFIAEKSDVSFEGGVTPEQIAGSKLRRSRSESTLIALREWGANPVSLSFGDLLQGMKEGVVDGAEGPPTSFIALGLADLVSDIVLTKFSSMIVMNFANVDWLKGVSAEHRSTLAATTRAVTEKQVQRKGRLFEERLGMVEDPPEGTPPVEKDINVHLLDDDQYQRWKRPLDPAEHRQLYTKLIRQGENVGGDGFYDYLWDTARSNAVPSSREGFGLESWWNDHLEKI